MTKKFRENFFILLSSNICTIVMVIIIPSIVNSTVTTDAKGIALSSYTSTAGIIYSLSCVILICVLYAFIKQHDQSGIVINNNVTPVQSINHPNESADYIREKHRKDMEMEKSVRIKTVTDYTYNIMSPFLTDDCLDLLCQNIKLFEVPGSSLTAIKTNGNLSTLDIKHYGWNIGERLGWSGQQRASFIKLCFPEELSELEVETIRRTFRQKGKCVIDLDIPAKDSFDFH